MRGIASPPGTEEIEISGDTVFVVRPSSPLDEGGGTKFYIFQKEYVMAAEDVIAGKIKQAKGKANDVVGAASGNSRQQIKGKAQQAVGKVQEAVGKASAKKPPRRP